eukprot:NODE_21441_length_753_cov_1.520767.p2 GENE.NODE_21441_length_753_cov_1.520767~~NODE_21441_length_753_cov_1.520767.p2  ORF type:complete len:144 (+),score=39.91 NODE_21441_length_753_cov_1.520767:112-543(+)
MFGGLNRLSSAYAVEQVVCGEQSKVVCLRLGNDYDPDCMRMDEVLTSAARDVEAACSIHAVGLQEVPECVQEFQLTTPMALMFFFKGKRLTLELGAGVCTDRISWVFGNRQEFIDLVEAVRRGVTQGRDRILCPRDYSLAAGY